MVSIRVASLMNCAVTSSGLRVPAKGTSVFIRACVASGSGGSSRPASSAASAMMTPTPPDTVMMPVLALFGSWPPAKA